MATGQYVRFKGPLAEAGIEVRPAVGHLQRLAAQRAGIRHAVLQGLFERLHALFQFVQAAGRGLHGAPLVPAIEDAQHV